MTDIIPLQPRLIRQINDVFWKNGIKNGKIIDNGLVYFENYSTGLKKAEFFIEKKDDIFIRKTYSYNYISEMGDTNNTNDLYNGFITDKILDRIIFNTRPDKVISNTINNIRQICMIYIEMF